jgi:hypothetical protein
LHEPDIALKREHRQEHSSSPVENPRGYCPDHSTGVACSIGVGVVADDGRDQSRVPETTIIYG